MAAGTSKGKARWDGFTEAELRDRWDSEVHVREQVGSTNGEARRLAEEADAPPGTVVVAAEQTSGRGRGQRSWASPAGRGVYLSILFRPSELDGSAPVSIPAGLGVVRALDQSLAGLAPRLKWPNDLYAHGLKFGGILAEAAWTGSTPRYLVVGVGVNVRPLGEGISAAIARRATSVDEEVGRTVPLVDVADAVVEGLRAHLAAPVPGLGASDLADLDHYDGMRDRRGTLQPSGGGEPVPGMCVGIAPDGALLFRPDRGALRRVTDGSLDPAV